MAQKMILSVDPILGSRPIWSRKFIWLAGILIIIDLALTITINNILKYDMYGG